MRGSSCMAHAVSIFLAILTVSCSPNRPTGMEESNSAEGGERIFCGTLWYRDVNGGCSPAVSTGYATTCAATVAGFEGDVGRRVASYETFSAGVIVTFRDGYKMPLWSTRIDCADPPLDPLKGWQPPRGEGGGIGVEPTPIDNEPSSTGSSHSDENHERGPPGSQGEPLVVPTGQAAEPWLKELLERQDGFCGDRPVVSRTSSLDGGFEYLEVCSWATSNDIIQRRTSDGRLREVGDGNNIKVIRTGPWRGFLLASRHRYHQGGGSYDATYVIRPDGKEMFEVPGSRTDSDAVSAWLTSHGWQAD